jgi:hypothetical protein
MATALTEVIFKGYVRFRQPNGNVIFPQTFTKTLEWQQEYEAGVGLAAVNRICVMEFTIAAGDTMIVDLQSGVVTDATPAALVDFNGEAITFARVKGIALQLVDEASGASSVSIDPATADAALTLAATVKAGALGAGNEGGFMWWDPTAAGVAITGGASDKFAVVNDDGVNAATVVLAIAGGAT